jgi:hypothetical protein
MVTAMFAVSWATPNVLCGSYKKADFYTERQPPEPKVKKLNPVLFNYVSVAS